MDEKYLPLYQITVDEETSATLEEQLRAVQKQLEALSMLPSAIQNTLDAVSKQLASIVPAKVENEDEGIDKTDEDLNRLEDGKHPHLNAEVLFT